MKEFQALSSVELGALIQRLYLRLEQYEIHAASLADGTFQREGADNLAALLRKRVIDVSALLARRLVEATSLDAGMVARTPSNDTGVGAIKTQAS